MFSAWRYLGRGSWERPGARTITTFDTLTAARDLEAASVETRQAEAIVAAMRDAAESDRAELVTRGELYRALWIQATALIGSQIAIASVTLLS